ncbi:MAG TPA: hypothetical protein VGP91_15765 [Actinoplanes sp.]|jgi:hypothetical protein|nr:hypothetical protein [Actinoplanes sp.]
MPFIQLGDINTWWDEHVPGAGHGVLLDKPDLCHLMINEFLG